MTGSDFEENADQLAYEQKKLRELGIYEESTSPIIVPEDSDDDEDKSGEGGENDE